MEGRVCEDCGELVPSSNQIVHQAVCRRHSQFRRTLEPTLSHVELASDADDVDEMDAQPEATDGGLTAESGLEPVSVICTSGACGAGGQATTSSSTSGIANTMAACEFCELEVLLSALDGHSVVCGNRTDVCERCFFYVRLKDMRAHAESGCRVGATASARRPPETTRDTDYLIPPGGAGPRERLRRRAPEEEIPRWAPVVVAGAGIAAAAAFALYTRRR